MIRYQLKGLKRFQQAQIETIQLELWSDPDFNLAYISQNLTDLKCIQVLLTDPRNLPVEDTDSFLARFRNRLDEIVAGRGMRITVEGQALERAKYEERLVTGLVES
jgi:hypothetical protein